MAETKDKVEVRAPNNPVVINTAEDATMAYLRGQMSEDEFKEACSAYGVLPGQLLHAPERLERPDDAFENTIPDELYHPTREHNPDLKERLEAADEKEKERTKASKAADKESDEVQKVEMVPAGTAATAATSKDTKDTKETPKASTQDKK